MTEYTVIWEIQILARDQFDAAKQALVIQRDPKSTALSFFVYENLDWNQDSPVGETIDLGVT